MDKRRCKVKRLQSFLAVLQNTAIQLFCIATTCPCMENSPYLSSRTKSNYALVYSLCCVVVPTPQFFCSSVWLLECPYVRAFFHVFYWQKSLSYKTHQAAGFKKKTTVGCVSRDVGLCIGSCFSTYHTEEWAANFHCPSSTLGLLWHYDSLSAVQPVIFNTQTFFCSASHHLRGAWTLSSSAIHHLPGV